MKQTVLFSPFGGEKYTRTVLDNGIRVLFFPKNRSSSTAMLGVAAGSVDVRCNSGGKSFVFPSGTAHFLEHKLFEKQDGTDAFDFFSRFGASSNAFTSYRHTAYHFSTSRDFPLCLRELVDFVTHPFFTEASVRREQGIIAQEIASENDNPGTVCLRGLFSALYEKHPVRNEIAGDAESILKITPEILTRFFRAYYATDRLILTISGRVRQTTALEIAAAIPPSDKVGAHTVFPSEKPTAYRKKSVVFRDVAKPLFAFGVKDVQTDMDSDALLKRRLSATLLCEILFGKSGDFFNRLYEKGLLSNRFSFQYCINRSFGFFYMYGDSSDPEAVLSAFYDTVGNFRKNGVPSESFERNKRLLFADSIRECDSTEDIAYGLFSAECEGLDFFASSSVLSSLGTDDLIPILDTLLDAEKSALSLVLPVKR